MTRYLSQTLLSIWSIKKYLQDWWMEYFPARSRRTLALLETKTERLDRSSRSLRIISTFTTTVARFCLSKMLFLPLINFTHLLSRFQLLLDSIILTELQHWRRKIVLNSQECCVYIKTRLIRNLKMFKNSSRYNRKLTMIENSHSTNSGKCYWWVGSSQIPVLIQSLMMTDFLTEARLNVNLLGE